MATDRNELQKFIDLVELMRLHQKQYFATQKQSNLISAKGYETAVDALLKKIQTGVDPERQSDLFAKQSDN
jgi:hypothetical protein